MKDMVPKGTGNSRFLRSSIPEGITHEELVALLRAGAFPVDFAGLNPDGIATQGSAYNKANVLPDSVCNLLGVSTSSEPKDAFSALYNKKWKELERITVSKKWTVPSGITRIGVFILGAGAGGDARGGYDFESRDGLYACGGSCGYVNNVILDVVPGQSFNVVIGSPGVGATSGYNVKGSNVTPGGDTKFGTYVAYGGNSPNVPERFYKTQVADSGEGDYPSTSANNGLPTMGVTDNNAICVSPLNCKNFFDVKMSLLSAGGSCSGSSFAQTGANTDLGKGGNARNAGISISNNEGNFKAGDATGYGNGGGACFAATSAQYKYQPTRTGGKGSQGLVIIYV